MSLRQAYRNQLVEQHVMNRLISLIQTRRKVERWMVRVLRERPLVAPRKIDTRGRQKSGVLSLNSQSTPNTNDWDTFKKENQSAPNRQGSSKSTTLEHVWMSGKFYFPDRWENPGKFIVATRRDYRKETSIVKGGNRATHVVGILPWRRGE